MLKKRVPPEALPGFAEVTRFWDFQNQCFSAKILPGEYYVTRNDEIIATVLGSCVAACVTDSVAGIGAMNHFLLPLHQDEEWSLQLDINNQATRYGNYAMEHMINDVLKYGAKKERLEFKVFGGAKVISNMGDIGHSNIDFVLNYLKYEGFSLSARDVGGNNPRKVRYFPKTGKVKIKKLKEMHNDTIIRREVDYKQRIDKPESVSGSVELF